MAGIPSALFLIVYYSTMIYIFNLSALFNPFERPNIDVTPGCMLHLFLDTKPYWEGCWLFICTFIATPFTVYKHKKQNKIINLRDDKVIAKIPDD